MNIKEVEVGMVVYNTSLRPEESRVYPLTLLGVFSGLIFLEHLPTGARFAVPKCGYGDCWEIYPLDAARRFRMVTERVQQEFPDESSAS